ncbi:MAG: Nre family DNA repair protein [Candidatus Jordarchaeales archaeon]
MVKPQVPREVCVSCKGSRLLCGKPRCPILMKFQFFAPVKDVVSKQEISGSSPPSFFVGHFGYPQVFVGPMLPPVSGENVSVFDRVEEWFGRNIEEILGYRSILVRGVVRVDVKGGWGRPVLEAQEAVMSFKPVDMEVMLEKKPRLKVEFDSHAQPMGPSAPLKSLKVTSNPVVPRKVDEIVGDSDLKASEGVVQLYLEGFPVSYISRLLSAALLGVEENRKLVPTRWAITATDDIISEDILSRVRGYPEIDKVMVFRESYLDNHFVILMVPHAWSFEQLEAWYPGTAWLLKGVKPVVVGDYEGYRGRKEYAFNVSGAYYAARLAVAEYLDRIRRQALVIVFREVRPGYIMPLGVWVIRETVRAALRGKPRVFEDVNEAIGYVKENLKLEWGYWRAKSVLLDLLLKQRTLKEFC